MSVLPSMIPNYTYSDYEVWEGDWELIEGVPFAMAPKPMIRHQKIEPLVWRAFYDAFDDEECEDCVVLIEVDWKVNEKTVVAPDVVVVCGEKGDKYLTKAPIIAVEILSPNTEKKDRVIKFELYQEEGVPYYIIINPDNNDLEIYKLVDGKYQRELFFGKKYKFTFESCEKEIDFDDVFKRVRI